MNFFKTFLASCLGTLVALTVIFMTSTFFFVGMVASVSSEEAAPITKTSVLKLDLNGQIREQGQPDPFKDFPGMENYSSGSTGLLDVKKALQEAATDEQIAGIYLDVSSFGGGFSQAREIRNELLNFQETSGKWVMAYAEYYTELSYYIASCASTIYLNPEGDLEFNGLAMEPVFFQGLLNKLEIKPEIFRVGKFKGAVEPFIRKNLSLENRKQLTELAEDLYEIELQGISDTRNIELASLRTMADKMTVSNPKEALEQLLVDSLAYYDIVLDELRTNLDLDSDDKIPFVELNKYLKSIKSSGSSKNQIAVIVAEGEIHSGESQEYSIGGNEFARLIRKARTNDRVKAIVLRINSPGGSALASDIMWREVALAAEVKPIVASMSDMAASGGYYLAMACDSIVADHTTITGSIGVFSVFLDMSKFMNNKLGITFDEVKTGDVGNLFSPMRPLTPYEKNIWQKRTNEVYETFTSKAAEGRNMPLEELKEVAEGRVWSGKRALALGLVDKLGELDDAIAVAASMAEVSDDYKLRFYPQPQSFYEKWLSSIQRGAATWWHKGLSREEHELIRQVKEVKKLQGTQARLPYDLKPR